MSRVCGQLERELSCLPFRVGRRTILVIRDLPVWECCSCSEFQLEDEVMVKVEELVIKVNEAAELKVVTFAT